MQVRVDSKTRSETLELGMLARLADGSLPPRQRVELEEYVAGSYEARWLLARQRHVVSALSGGGPATSPEFRHLLAIAELSREDGAQRPARRPSPRLALALTVVAMVIVVAAGVKVFGNGGSSSSPTIASTALLAFHQPTGPAPVANPRDPSLLEARLGGVTFPNYARSFGARASGERTDLTDGRTVRTVYYTLRDGARISYSVLSGPALGEPSSMREQTVRGIPLRMYTEHGLQVVALVRHGSTCVLAGKVAAGTMAALASAPLTSGSRA
jgi:hypothetical protein